jgi:2,3-diaminopropionate biosynthesis protein SbnB
MNTSSKDIMILNEDHIHQLGIEWDQLIAVIEYTVRCMSEQDFAQPVKPYLRYRNLKNRIIAMPAFVGGDINMAGLKWIASFPENINKGIPRAHSVVVLNNADTGEPLAIVNTTLLSIIRTASVSGLILKRFMEMRKTSNLTIGITGFGPIGQYHLKMCQAVLRDKIDKILIYDKRPVQAVDFQDDRIEIVQTWQEAYSNSDIFMTCTVSDAPYIDMQPKKGSLHLNVSLRDYKTSVYPWFKNSILVDNWEEVCRERTDIEMLHIEKGLDKDDTKSIIDIVVDDCLKEYDPAAAIIFNPMGMAVFDIAIGSHYYKSEKKRLKNKQEALAVN